MEFGVAWVTTANTKKGNRRSSPGLITFPPTPPARSPCQLRQLFVRGMVPMIGFGFIDNVIMLSAGDLIDQQFGSVLQVSTLTI